MGALWRGTPQNWMGKTPDATFQARQARTPALHSCASPRRGPHVLLSKWQAGHNGQNS